MQHHFTVDVEEYFQVSALEPIVPRDSWNGYESRVERSTLEVLEMLEAAGHRGTFFVLGWIAERHPALVRRIATAGHEVASHGWDHRKVTGSTPDQFRDSVRRSKSLLEDLAGARVQGFRAPSFSIVPGHEWAFDVLIEEGYVYDSSLFPIRRPGYGYPGAPRDRHTIKRAVGELEEFPPATLAVMGALLPAAGGAYLRLLPEDLIARALRQAEVRGEPGMFYIHPWEIDPDQPRMEVPLPTRIRHYGGLGRCRTRIERLLGTFRFCAVAETLRHDASRCAAVPVEANPGPVGATAVLRA